MRAKRGKLPTSSDPCSCWWANTANALGQLVAWASRVARIPQRDEVLAFLSSHGRTRPGSVGLVLNDAQRRAWVRQFGRVAVLSPSELADLVDRAAKNAAKAARVAATDSLEEIRNWVSEAVATAPRLLHVATRDRVLPPGDAL